MLGFLKRKKSTLLDMNELQKKPLKVLEIASKDASSTLGRIAQDEDFSKFWVSSVHPKLEEISKILNLNELKTILREHAMTSIERSMRYRCVHAAGTEIEDANLFAVHLTQTEDVSIARGLCVRSTAANDANVMLFRAISWDIGDASNDDWFLFYAQFYENYANLYFSLTLKELKGEDDPVTPLLFVASEAKRAELRSIVLGGGQLEKY